jgi:hypothetical protein
MSRAELRELAVEATLPCPDQASGTRQRFLLRHASSREVQRGNEGVGCFGPKDGRQGRYIFGFTSNTSDGRPPCGPGVD